MEFIVPEEQEDQFPLGWLFCLMLPTYDKDERRVIVKQITCTGFEVNGTNSFVFIHTCAYLSKISQVHPVLKKKLFEIIHHNN